MRTIRLAALALAFTFMPACSTLPPGANAGAQAQALTSLERQAYALVEIYSTALDAASRLVAHPDTAPALVDALSRAEAVATPAAHAVLAALDASVRAAHGPESARDSASALMALAQAIEEARGPISQLAEASGP